MKHSSVPKSQVLSKSERRFRGSVVRAITYGACLMEARERLIRQGRIRTGEPREVILRTQANTVKYMVIDIFGTNPAEAERIEKSLPKEVLEEMIEAMMRDVAPLVIQVTSNPLISGEKHLIVP